ncbi:MAG: flagellar hook-associated protein FlgK [Roseburia sp.]|nr:flagellar hook-associated protein FlgK [Roseburia sp.]
MANGFGSLYVGSSGLQSAQNALNTTANNLANVNTTGYVRQQVLHTDRNYNVIDTSAAISYQQSGLGVKIGDVIHARDIFLDKSFRTESGRQAFYAATAEAVQEVYTFYQELEGEAFQDSLQDLWTSFQEFSKDPSDSVNQNLVIQKASLFVSRSAGVYEGLKDYQRNINQQISDDIDRINELGQRIYELNIEIKQVESGHMETAMTLRDERDNCLDELATFAEITYKEDVNGMVKVSIEGMEFVDEARVYEMGKLVDEITEFVTPYWPHSSTPSNGEYDEVFSYTTEISSEMGTDIGELKALILARGDRAANYNDIVGVSQKEYNKSTADHIATGMSVMLQAEAQLDQLFHGIITSINDLLCPNTEASNVIDFQGADSIDIVDVNGVTHTIKADELFLDAENTSVGIDGELPPTELFKRIGTERYEKIEAEDGNVYYRYIPEDPEETSMQYTIASVEINHTLIEQETKFPHLKQDGQVNYALAEELAALWDIEGLTVDPNDTNKVTYMDYYSNMIGAFGTLGSVYESTASSLSDTVTSVTNQRSQVIGVSSDEELTKMIKYQNAYNASSRFINVIDEMIEHMIMQLGA